MDGFRKERAYIATQGPVPDSFPKCDRPLLLLLLLLLLLVLVLLLLALLLLLLLALWLIGGMKSRAVCIGKGVLLSGETEPQPCCSCCALCIGCVCLSPCLPPSFWQMIWEQDVNLIVMVASEIEAGKLKCHRYWPELDETVS